MPHPAAIQVREVYHAFEDFSYRTPIKFGGVALDRATLLNVWLTVETLSGKIGHGFGSMPLGNVWSFPTRRLSYDQTLEAMRQIAGRIAGLYQSCTETGHPVDITMSLEHSFFDSAVEVEQQLGLGEPIPRLCTLVCASPFDAALHDAFGKLHGVSSYRTYGRDFLPHDLGRYLGPEFAGEWLGNYVLQQPKPRMPLYHLIGALDPLEEQDVQKRIDDGLPETLPEWIRFNGLTHLKIKLNGDDLDWDVARIVRIDRVTAEAQRGLGTDRWHYSLDFNERCPNVGYLLDLLNRVRGSTSDGFERIQYVEQPTARDLKGNRANVMHEASRLRPVVIDESLVDLESLQIARDMGYTGAALKACKGQTQSLLMAAAAQKYGMFLCVQDLTCPGASLVHSAGLAAHVPGVAAIEANSRQYVPAANRPWEPLLPGIFRVTDGTLETGALAGPGLGIPPHGVPTRGGVFPSSPAPTR